MQTRILSVVCTIVLKSNNRQSKDTIPTVVSTFKHFHAIHSQYAHNKITINDTKSIITLYQTISQVRDTHLLQHQRTRNAEINMSILKLLQWADKQQKVNSNTRYERTFRGRLT